MAKQKKSRQKKSQTRVDFTPMVDMMMLLITFFMLCTSLAKPQTIELGMPSNDKNIEKQDKSVTKESLTITIYVTADNQIHYVEGMPKYDDPTCLKKTTWGKDGIRKVLITHVAADGTQPVQQVMIAKAKLDKKRHDNPKFTKEMYDDELRKIKNGEIDGGKIETMTVIIKVTENAAYTNLVDIIDEMNICAINKFMPVKIEPDDIKLLDEAGVKR